MYLVVDDHPLARKGLEQIIHMYCPEEEVLEAGTVREAVSRMDEAAVSVAFIDIRLGAESGFDVLKWVKESRRDVRTSSSLPLRGRAISFGRGRWGWMPIS